MKKSYNDEYRDVIIIIDQLKNEFWRWYVTFYNGDKSFNSSYGANKFFARSVLKEAQRNIDKVLDV